MALLDMFKTKTPPLPIEKLDKNSFEYKWRRAQAMISRREDSGLDDMYDWMDNAYHSQWQLPSVLKEAGDDWVHRVTSTDPHDAIRAGTRTLATVMPTVNLMPTMNNKESREVANKVEKVLEWQFAQACQRRSTSTLSDIILSALLYDEVIVGVWDLEEQIKILKEWGLPTTREEYAKKFGRFIIKSYNPRDTIVEYSDLMPERVLFREVLPVTEVIDYWGDRATEISDLSEAKAYKEKKYCTVYDYNELGHRTVFVTFQEHNSGYTDISPENAFKILDESTPYKFLPFAAKVGGTGLSKNEKYKRIPLLWSVYLSGQWETQNMTETLLASEGLIYAIAPRYAVESDYDDADVDLDFRNPVRIARMKRGQKMHDLRPPELNHGLEMLADRNASRMSKSTVPRVLQSSDYMNAEAFSSLNLATQSGVKSITPYKVLAEACLADVFTAMLYWIHYSKTPFQSLVPTKVPDKNESGVPYLDTRMDTYTVDGSSDFDVENIYLRVKLTEDTPVDYMGKINAGAQLVERLHYSYADALEFVGINDPESAIKLRTDEEKEFTEAAAENQKLLNEVQLQYMQKQQQMDEMIAKLQQMEAQIQQAMAAAQAQDQGQGGGPGGPGGMMPGPGGGPGGPGEMIGPDGSVPPAMQQLAAARRYNQPENGQSPFPSLNPAAGDMPPVNAAPGVGLREEKQQVQGK